MQLICQGQWTAQGIWAEPDATFSVQSNLCKWPSQAADEGHNDDDVDDGDNDDDDDEIMVMVMIKHNFFTASNDHDCNDDA